MIGCSKKKLNIFKMTMMKIFSNSRKSYPRELQVQWRFVLFDIYTHSTFLLTRSGSVATCSGINKNKEHGESGTNIVKQCWSSMLSFAGFSKLRWKDFTYGTLIDK